jgi:hypothetical protein
MGSVQRNGGSKVDKTTRAMRGAFNPGFKMSSDYLVLLFRNAEVSRSTACVLSWFARVCVKDYGKADLRTELIAELKSLRANAQVK